MVPKYSELVSTVFRQVIANHHLDKLDNPTELKIHAEVTGALAILAPDVRKVSINHTSFVSTCEVEIDCGDIDPLYVFVTVDYNSNSVQVAVA